MSTGGLIQARGRIRAAPDEMRRRPAPSWMPWMMDGGMWVVRKCRAPVTVRRKTAAETRAPAAVVTGRDMWVERAAAAMAWGVLVSEKQRDVLWGED